MYGKSMPKILNAHSLRSSASPYFHATTFISSKHRKLNHTIQMVIYYFVWETERLKERESAETQSSKFSINNRSLLNYTHAHTRAQYASFQFISHINLRSRIEDSLSSCLLGCVVHRRSKSQVKGATILNSIFVRA